MDILSIDEHGERHHLDSVTPSDAATPDQILLVHLLDAGYPSARIVTPSSIAVDLCDDPTEGRYLVGGEEITITASDAI